VATIGRLDADHRAQHGEPMLPASVEPAEVYQGAVTVLMRLVFLLYAEERGLLRVDDDLYADAYAISTLAEQLREWASDVGEDTLERSTTAWQRMLATFRAIHRGARHDQLTLPGYGGSLFDPDRFPWLEGRPNADAGLEDSEPLRIDDRTVLRALEALQWLRFAGERRRVSFRVLDALELCVSKLRISLQDSLVQPIGCFGPGYHLGSVPDLLSHVGVHRSLYRCRSEFRPVQNYPGFPVGCCLGHLPRYPDVLPELPSDVPRIFSACDSIEDHLD